MSWAFSVIVMHIVWSSLWPKWKADINFVVPWTICKAFLASVRGCPHGEWVSGRVGVRVFLESRGLC